MADAVGLGGLHDLGFYVCDLCQEQCQQNEELNALGESCRRSSAAACPARA